MKILSQSDCENVMNSLDLFDRNIENYSAELEKAIVTFSTNPIVQSFYASGIYGKGIEEELEKVRNGIRKYYQAISADGGLTKTTKQIISRQMEILNGRR